MSKHLKKSYVNYFREKEGKIRNPSTEIEILKYGDRSIVTLPKYSPLCSWNDCPDSDRLFFRSGETVILNDNNTFTLYKKSDAAYFSNVSNGYICRFINQNFIYDEYTISDETITLLKQISGDEGNGLKNLAMLAASAHINGYPLPKSTLFATQNETSASAVNEFLHRLLEGNIYALNSNACKSSSGFLSAYSAMLLAGCGAYVIDKNLQLDYELIRAVVKSKLLQIKDNLMGNIKFKNTLPLVVITKDEGYANGFSVKVPSNMIKPCDGLSAQLVHNIDNAEFEYLRQSLVLYGMKLLLKKASDTKKRVKSEKANPEDIFVDKFCKKQAGTYEIKSDVKAHYKEFCERLRFNYIPGNLFNKLTNLSYDSTHNHRTDKGNVYVIKDLNFDTKKFNDYLNNTGKTPQKGSFDDALNELYASTRTSQFIRNFIV